MLTWSARHETNGTNDLDALSKAAPTCKRSSLQDYEFNSTIFGRNRTDNEGFSSSSTNWPNAIKRSVWEGQLQQKLKDKVGILNTRARRARANDAERTHRGES